MPLPAPTYNLWQAVSVCLAAARRAIEEVRALKAMPPSKGEDGRGVEDIELRDGNLVIRWTDGQEKSVGRVVGRDGLSFDRFKLDMDYDGQRTFTFRWTQGSREESKSFTMPVVIDKGIYRDGTYDAGDGVTFAGCFWIAQKKTDAKPGTDDWRLAVKKGRDGKDVVAKAPRPEGQPVKIGA